MTIVTEDYTGEGPFADLCKLSCISKNVGIDWYKHIGRSMYSTPRELDSLELFTMLTELMKAIKETIDGYESSP